jgi:O-antigen ligase
MMDRVAYFAAGAFVLLVSWNGFRFGGGALNNAFLVLSAGAAFTHALVARRPVPLPPWLLAAGGGLVLAAMLNIIFPPDSTLINKTLISYRTDFSPPVLGPLAPRPDLLALGKLLIGLIGLPILFALVANTVDRVKRLADLFVVSTAVNGLVAMINSSGIPISPVEHGDRATGLTVHPNYLALTCTIGIPLALWWVSRGGRWRIAGVVATGLLLAGALLSGSRAGGVSAPLALVATVAAIPNLRRALGYVLPVTGLVVISLLAFTNAGTELLEQLRFRGDPTTTGSDNARAELADLALEQFEARPLQGIGFQVIQDAHSIYLQLLAAGGVIAFAAFLTYLWGLWDARRRAGPERDLATAATVAIAMWLVNGIYDSQLADKYLYVIPAILVALSYAVSAKPVPARRRRRAPTPAGGARRPATASLAVASPQHVRPPSTTST